MRARCMKGSWLGMTKRASISKTSKRNLTHAVAVFPSSSAVALAGLQVPQQHPQHPQVPAALTSLATLATAATSTTTTTTTIAIETTDEGLYQHHHYHHYHHHHHHHHHHHTSPYHPYLSHRKPSSCPNSGGETEDDEYTEFQHRAEAQQQQQLQQQRQQKERPQFHPQHHHRLIVPSRTTSATNSPNRSSNKYRMPRRKETKKIQIDIPSSQASAGIEGDPHQVFKCNGSPIISPRSIRNSLAEPDFDLEGNPRPQKQANIASVSNGNADRSSGLVVAGPVPPPTKSSPTTTGKTRTKNRRRINGTSRAQPQEDDDDDAGSEGSRDSDVNGAQKEMDLLALKEDEKTLAGLSGVQLWVHRLLYTHHQTLHLLGLEREDFPNTRLSMKQLETMLSPVISLANMMTPDHFGIHVPTPQIAQTMNDVHYWKLWESDTIDIG